jgi:hypothetical protein
MAPQHSAPTTHPSPATATRPLTQPRTITKDQIHPQQEHNPRYQINSRNYDTTKPTGFQKKPVHDVKERRCLSAALRERFLLPQENLKGTSTQEKPETIATRHLWRRVINLLA